MSLRRVLVALTGIALLAIALPYAAVRTLHERRLALADTELDRLAAAANGTIGRAPAVNVLLGPGRVPKANDTRWLDGASYPLDSALSEIAVTADPWGNGFVINAGASPSSRWLLSAGPNGTLETPFDGSSGRPLGDDRGRHLR
jgi:hypothetical protein